MSSEQIVSRALESNAFEATATAAGYITPTVWSRRIEEFAKAKLVVAPLGLQDNSLNGKEGSTFYVAVDSELTAGALTESTAIAAVAISYTQIAVTPTEYGIGVQVTRKNLDRAFKNTMENITKNMGYAMAKVKDTTIISGLVSSAGNSVVANAVAATALASTDTIDTDDIANAITTLRVDDENANYIIIHPAQENDLLKLSDFIDASVYGGREVVLGGEIGRYLGMRVLVTTQISAGAGVGASNGRYALVIGDRPFVYCQKRGVTFDKDYGVYSRAYDMAAVEDWGFAVLRSNSICTLLSYTA